MQGFAVTHDYSNNFNLPDRMPQAHSIVTLWGARIECTLVDASTSDIQATSWTYQFKGDNFSFRKTCYGGLAGNPLKDMIVAFRDAETKSRQEVLCHEISDSWGNKKGFLYVYKNKVVATAQSTYDPVVWRTEEGQEDFSQGLLEFPDSDLSLKAKKILEEVRKPLSLRENDISSRFREEDSTLWILICSGGGAEIDINLVTELVRVSCREILRDISLTEAIEHILSIRRLR